MSDHAVRLESLRRVMAADGVDGFVVPRADEHLGEYVPDDAERLAWLTGFTGSAGMAIVLAQDAAAFTDGRYTLQMAEQVDPALFRLMHITDEPPPAWVAAHVPGGRIGYDPRLISADGLSRFEDAGLTMVPLDHNLIDRVWTDRPTAPCAPMVMQPIDLAGAGSTEKRSLVAASLSDAGEDAAVLTDPASIAWLLNIRGGDVDYTPFALAFAVVHRTGRVDLFVDPAKLSSEIRSWLGNEVSVMPPDALAGGLQELAGRRVRVDRAGSPVWFTQRLEAAGATVTNGPDPCTLPKACKNAVERSGARAAHRRDAAALCRFLHWLDTGRTGGTTEMDAAARLLAFRSVLPGFRGESFPAISGSGPNGAIIHYRVTPATDRVLGQNEVYLIDSGAQFQDGTTDVTRAVWTGPGDVPDPVRDTVTRVLRGHIAIATAVFPKGIGGAHLDALARLPLWAAGLDYDHGTGHGVGSYLSVHEGPVSLSRNGRAVPLDEGMILSNEPGFYAPGEYGVRLENLLLVRRHDVGGAKKLYLAFETLTLAPFDRRLIDVSMLTDPERLWLDAYHARVAAEIGPDLEPDARAWLALACRPLELR